MTDVDYRHLPVRLLDVDPVNPRDTPTDVDELAASIAGLDQVPCMVHTPADDTEALAIATAENVGRAAMNPIEEARAFRRLLDGTGTTCGRCR